MMDIVMLVAGAGVGAMLRDLFVLHRGDKNKERQQLESETPYDYALANARADNNRYRDELFTIQAIKRTEADTERIRNEIGTILSDDGEEASEGAYGGLNGIPIVQNSDGTISLFPRWDGMNTEEAAWDAGAVARAYQANVREDVSKDERLSGYGAECSSYWRLANLAEERRQVTVHWKSPAGEFGEHFEHKHTGQLNGYSRTQDGLEHITVGNVCIDGDKVECITKGDDINGETLYRKGNR